MDLYTIATVLLFYGVAKGAKQALRTGGGDIIIVPEESEEKPSRVMALFIVEDVEEERNPSSKNDPVMSPLIKNPEVMMPWIEHPQKMMPLIKNPEIMMPWIEHPQKMMPLIKNPEIMMPWVEHPQKMVPLIEVGKPKYYDDDEDTSGEFNSDEYSDSTDNESGTESESNYYHEDDYIKAKIMKKIAKLNAEKNYTEGLRNRWKPCQKKASKICRQACVASYKNACEDQSCKKKLKKKLKKECKRNCKEFFIDS